MGYDAMATGGVAASIPAAAVSRDAGGGGGKKKRANRSAKLKQYKLDARREQWLNQVKGKDDGKDRSPVESPTSPNLPRPRHCEINSKARSGHDRPDDGPLNGNNGDWVPQVHNPVSSGSRRRNSSPSHSLTSGSSFGSSSRSISDVEEDDNEVLDDWEAVADALSEDNNEGQQHHNEPDPLVYPVDSAVSPGKNASRVLHNSGAATKPEPIRNAPRAWQPDDVARPQSLPSISKQWSFPLNADRHCGNFHQKGILSLPTSCPICCEDLDPTDSSFLPCSCGFHLCLFCHKRILEADGRCPGCRKKYESIAGGLLDANTAAPFRLSRSCSMSSRI